ncbi:uncharacterized protein LOC127073273 [Lathyrus oleraceus]|uniref:Putative plant transposon protein domain-containing protein n=1 Tax=Pisum sativum TaxID=3888 RepID=A0A9D4XBG0_PEA|nr:uncharacterized protein LOC127073273 [Pisum sativum]KAI5415720.1 hypothetical protein KIW84_040942 [Pisum sativum]
MNTYIGDPFTLEEGELDEYAKRLTRGGLNINLVIDTLVLSVKSYETNASGSPKNFPRKNLRTMTQVMMMLVIHNIRPRSDTSSVPLDTAYLLYYILDYRQVDVARIIPNEIKIIDESGHRLGSRTPCTLAFPEFITGLCMRARRVIPSQVQDTVSGVMDDRYIERFCLAKNIGQGSTSTSPVQKLGFEDWDPRLQATFTHTWD